MKTHWIGLTVKLEDTATEAKDSRWSTQEKEKFNKWIEHQVIYTHKWNLKKKKKKNVAKAFLFEENYKPIDLRNSTKPTHKKHKETT